MTRQELVELIETQMSESGVESETFAKDLADTLDSELFLVDEEDEFDEDEDEEEY